MEQPYLYYVTWGEGGSPTPSILPKELQACEYLETDGASWIEIDVKANLLTYIDARTKQNVAPSSTSWFGASSTTTVLQSYASATQTYAARTYQQTNSYTTSSQPIGQWLDFYFDLNTRKIKFNQEELTVLNFNKNNITTNLRLFGSMVVGTWYPNQANCQITHFETNLCNLYACYVKSGETFVDTKGNACQAGTPGMYDVVNNLFYTNDGTGTFTVGPDIIL